MPFEISFGGFVNFFFGIFTGMILFAVLIVFFTMRGKRIDVNVIKKPNVDVNEDEVKDMIIFMQKRFKAERKVTDENIGKLTFLLSYELVEEIAKYFFPESRHPMLELSVNELIALNHYITDRIDELLEKPILKNTKNVRVIRVMQMFEKKIAIEESKIAKAAKKMRVGKVIKYGGAVLNAVNPVYWVRKAVINTSVDAMTRKVCVVIIGIVGEETTKIYSKKVFENPLELELVEKDMIALLEGEDDEEDK